MTSWSRSAGNFWCTSIPNLRHALLQINKPFHHCQAKNEINCVFFLNILLPKILGHHCMCFERLSNASAYGRTLSQRQCMARSCRARGTDSTLKCRFRLLRTIPQQAVGHRRTSRSDPATRPFQTGNLCVPTWLTGAEMVETCRYIRWGSPLRCRTVGPEKKIVQKSAKGLDSQVWLHILRRCARKCA